MSATFRLGSRGTAHATLCSEDLNTLVRRHISTAVSAAPGRALGTLEQDTTELIANGMVTLNSKLNGVEDEKLVARVVELWTFFWTQVLPYLEGVSLSPHFRERRAQV